MEIIFENDYFIAINKPAGMLSIPDRTQSEPSLKDWLQKKYGSIFTVHRLDKFTSGLIVFAKDAATHKLLSVQFMGREVKKIYLGLVHGTLQPASGTAEAAIAEHPAKNGKMMVHAKGKPSATAYETIESFRNFSLVKYNILTGRTHQIRVHTAYLGSYILCDELYGDGRAVFISQIKRNYKLSKDVWEEKPMLNRLALHSYQLSFVCNNQNFMLQAELPKDMSALLQQLKKYNT